MIHCDTIACQASFPIAFIMLALHLWTNIEAMQAWAHFNLLLLSGTAWFLFILFWNHALILEYPGFMEMETWKRTVPFALALMYFVYWMLGLIGELLKLWAGATPGDVNFEIIFAYILYINFPSALISLSYTIFEVLHTDDFSFDLDDDSDHEDDDDRI